ncbi:MAG: hypothetical protein WD232_07745 [Acidimicrobiales bacterium]
MTAPAAIAAPGSATAPPAIAALPSVPAAMPEIPGFPDDDHASGPVLLGLLGLIAIALRGRRSRPDPKLLAAPLDGGGELLDFR